MESDVAHALIESLRLINVTLEKMARRIEVLENDFKERSIKKRLFRWLVAFYPLVIIMLVMLVDSDHHKISEIAGDVSELIKDTQSFAIYANSEDY